LNPYEIILITVIFILGSVIGSFLNVCIYRIPAGISIVTPRSRCGSCGRTLSSIDLIPILSWIILRGKCRTCGSAISPRYALVEALQGILYVALFYRFGLSAVTPVMWLFISILTVVFFIDLDHQIIPNKVVLFGLASGLIPVIMYWSQGYPLYESVTWYEPLLGLTVPFLLMLAVALLSVLFFKQSGIGMGDVKIYAPIGLFIGWKLSLMSIWFAFFFGGLFGLLWIFVFKRDKKEMIPFAPFIVIGVLVTLFWGDGIMQWLY